MARRRGPLSIRGDFKKLNKNITKISGSEDLLRVTSKAMAEETIDLIKEGFRKTRDPYGEIWAPKKVSDGRNALSGKTGMLKTGYNVFFAEHNGFTVAASVEYSTAHQSPRRKEDGTLKRPKRMQIPVASEGLPADWVEAYEDTALDAVKEHFGG